ncbi:MAG: AraC family transcriptional regulator ligand-binding domain-containing protein [Burkholderiaceae bacterium]|jgi:AraC-like DNA-binding protein
MHFVPAVSVEALLVGLQGCGVDTAKIRRVAGLASRYADPSEMLPSSLWEIIWLEAAKLDPRPELPALAACQVPFGLFGSLDYLAGSARTARGGLQALADHFSAAAAGIELELDFDGPDEPRLRIINSVPAALEFESDEFTTAVILDRFRNVTGGQFQPRRVYLTRPTLKSDLHVKVFGAPVIYGAPHAGFECTRKLLDLEQSMADPRLHDALLQIAKKLGFANDSKNGIEVAVRSRLRSLMPRGQAVAERVARSLGVSERTLHRRLADSGISFQDILDQFRIEESERLLARTSTEFSAIALALGFSDQAAWNRFFRRLRHMSPTAWQNAQSEKK